jgi:DNA-binding CsgD family transcriptional regulator
VSVSFSVSSRDPVLDDQKRKRARLIEVLIRQGWSPPPPSSQIVDKLAGDMRRVSQLAQTSIPQWQPKLRLSPGETRVLAYAAAGYSVPQSARLLERSPETLKEQLKNAREKLGARNTTHAVAIAIRRGLIA